MDDVLNAFVLISNYLLIPAFAYGCQLALGALGITIVYAVLRFSNFSHGEMMSFGAMIAILLTWKFQSLGISIAPLPTALLSLPVAILVTIAMTLTADRLVYKGFRKVKAKPVIFIIASIGIMFVLNGVTRFIIGPNDQKFGDGERFIMSAREFKSLTGLSEGLAFKTSQLLTIVIAIGLVAALFWFLNKTRTGKAMRAYSDNEDLALLSGINPERVVIIAWSIAAALATVAGLLYGLDKAYKPFIFQQLLLLLFASAIVGGIGNPIGAIAGGFLIAFSEVTITYAYKKFMIYLLPDSLEPSSLMQILSTNYKFAVSFIILVLVLIFKPKGLFKGRHI